MFTSGVIYNGNRNRISSVKKLYESSEDKTAPVVLGHSEVTEALGQLIKSTITEEWT